LDNLKQGDVPERQISIRAQGALAALIPPLELSPGSFGSVYSRPADLDNVQNTASFTGTRTEYWTYLLDTEGRHIIPGIEISWLDPRSGNLKQTSIAEREILVAANPDMDFLLSMQDSLQALLATGDIGVEKESFNWLGLNWWQLLVLVLSIFVFLLFLTRWIRRMAFRVRAKKSASRESEQWYFEQLLKAGDKRPEIFMSALLSWYDRFRKDSHGKDRFGPALESFIYTLDNDELNHSLSQLEQIVFGGADPRGWSGKILSDHLGEARKKAGRKQDPASVGFLKTLNP
jgi:hypothetical protein